MKRTGRTEAGVSTTKEKKGEKGRVEEGKNKAEKENLRKHGFPGTPAQKGGFGLHTKLIIENRLHGLVKKTKQGKEYPLERTGAVSEKRKIVWGSRSSVLRAGGPKKGES